ncbi:MAG: DUF503 domain-containing protein [Planctomycetota bacterium]|nr:MAG: DUF503 domain-containing protein [Planctomycetota bacterium]
MIVGVLSVDLSIAEARSLKDKRRVILGLKDRLRHHFNVSVAEVDHLDAPQRCRLGIATVSRESRTLHARLDKLVEAIRRTRGLSLIDYSRELL